LLLFVFFNRQYLIFSLCEYLYGICRLYVIFVLLMIFDAFLSFILVRMNIIRIISQAFFFSLVTGRNLFYSVAIDE